MTATIFPALIFQVDEGQESHEADLNLQARTQKLIKGAASLI